MRDAHDDCDSSAHESVQSDEDYQDADDQSSMASMYRQAQQQLAAEALPCWCAAALSGLQGRCKSSQLPG